MTARISVLAVAISGLPLMAVAQDVASYRSFDGDVVRRVEVAYLTGDAVPCEVRDFKDTKAPGRAETTWRADNETGYCEEGAEARVERLRGFGWICVAAQAPLADDTDTLGAGGDAEP
jgi:hypothetical protein